MGRVFGAELKKSVGELSKEPLASALEVRFYVFFLVP